VGRGRARGAGHRIGARRTKKGFGGRGWNAFSVRRAPNPFGGRDWRCSNRAFSTSAQPYTATALPAHSSCRHCNFVLSAVWRPANDFQHEEMMVPHLSRVLLVATTRRMPKVSQRPASPCRLVVAKMSYVPCPDA
jgi:hypothetical protein